MRRPCFDPLWFYFPDRPDQVKPFTAIKGMLRFPLIFFCLCRSNGANFAWACLITISNRFYRNFLPKGLLLLENGKTGFLCFTRVVEPAHISKISIWSRGSMAHCFNLFHNVPCRTTEETAPSWRWQRFQSTCNQSVLIFFSLLGSHVLVLFFHLPIFFILNGLVDLILLWNYSNVFAQLFGWKWSRNNLRIK